GLVMLVVVIFERFLRHMRREGVVGIGKVGKREGHGVMSENDGRQLLTETLIEGSNALKHLNLPDRPIRRSRPGYGSFRREISGSVVSVPASVTCCRARRMRIGAAAGGCHEYRNRDCERRRRLAAGGKTARCGVATVRAGEA